MHTPNFMDWKHVASIILINPIPLLLADQFIACGKSRDKAHELASLIWLAVIDNFEENQETFLLLKRLAFEGDVRKFPIIIFLSAWFENIFK